MMADKLYPDTVIRTGSHIVTSMCHISLPLTKNSHTANKQLLIAGTEAGDVVVWELSTQMILQTICTESTMVLSVIPLTECHAVIVYTRGQKVTLLKWCEESKQLQVKYSSQLHGNMCPTFCPISVLPPVGDSGVYYMCVPAERDIGLHMVHTDNTYSILSTNVHLTNDVMVTCMTMSTYQSLDSDTVSVLVGDEAGYISLYTLDYSTLDTGAASHQPIFRLNAHGKEPVLAIDYDPTSRTGVSAGGGGVLSIWKCVDDCQLTNHKEIQTSSKGFNSVRLRSDCKLLVLCAWDGVVRLYSPKSGKLLALLNFHRQSATSVSFANSKHFVTSSKDNVLCLWSLYAKR